MTLKNEIPGYVHTVLQNPKVALSVSGGTIATGSATWLDWVQDDIGFYASLFGWALSAVLIYTNIKGSRSKRRLERAEFEVAQLEKQKLQHELDEIRNKNV